MSAPAYLEGVRRAKPGAAASPRKLQWSLLLWGFLAVMFLLLWKLFQGGAMQAPRAEPAVDPVITHPLLSSPWLFASALSALVAAVGALGFRRFVHGQFRALAPVDEARLALAQGDADRAAEILRAALQRTGGAESRAALLHALAQVAAERGHFAAALEIVDEALAVLGPAPTASARETTELRVAVRMTRADALLALGRPDEAAVELSPPPAAWFSNARAQAYALAVRLAAGRRDRDGVLGLLRDHATVHARRLPLRERWLLRALEHLARDGRVPADALPADPALRRWIVARAPGAEASVDLLGGAA